MYTWPQPELTAVVREFLDENEAVTISAFTRISNLVADSYVVSATKRAAELFGYSYPQELEGRFISSLHKLEDIRITRLISTMRALGIRGDSETYPMRIVRKDGAFVPVLKHVTQRELAGTTIWISYHEPTSRNEGPPAPDPAAITEEAVVAYCGSFSVSEAEQILLQHAKMLTRSINMDKNPLLDADIQHNMSDIDVKNITIDVSPNVVHVATDAVYLGTGPGESLMTNGGHWVHRCKFCGYEWMTQNHRPLRCANQHKKQGRFICNRTKWWRGAPEFTPRRRYKTDP